MKVIVAPDSFKGSLPAGGVASAIAAGWRSVRPKDDVVERPMADGGEGTLAALGMAWPLAERRPVTVSGPTGAPVEAYWLWLPPTPEQPGGTGVVELASTCGIELLPDGLAPWDAGTLGLGQAVAAALDAGVTDLVLGIGSSASTDGGAGLLQALGARLLDSDSRPIPTGARGLALLSTVDVSSLRQPPSGGVTVLTDVTNPLTGPRGAAAVFGPQKGLSASDVTVVDALLGRLASLLGVDPGTPGSGAAGGTGAALLFWGADLVSGADEVARLIGLPEELAGADFVVTGEGAFDAQSAAGKVPGLVTRLAASAGVGRVLVAGRIATDADVSAFDTTVSLTELAGGAERAMADPVGFLTLAGARLAAAIPTR